MPVDPTPRAPSRDPFEDAYRRGARLFDDGAFFEAHEAWEDGWRLETATDARRFLQGLIQIAAGFHKLVVARSPSSASRLLEKGIAKLDACPDEIAARSLAGFVDDVRAFGAAIARRPMERSSIPKMAR